MSNLGDIYYKLGRHPEALELQVKTLEFRRRVLADNHPEIGANCFLLFIGPVIRHVLF